jgi:S-adenosylhomocysteine hydrolase
VHCTFLTVSTDCHPIGTHPKNYPGCQYCQSTIDGIIRATLVLLAGKNFVVAAMAGAGDVLPPGRGMGALVIVTEFDLMEVLEVVMDGYQVTTMENATKVGDFCTVPGEIARLTLEAMGVKIDTLTPEQVKYMGSWEEGT